MKIGGFFKKQNLLRGLILLLAGVFCVFLTVWIGVPMVKFASNPQKFRLWVETRGAGGKLAYLGMVFFQVVVALLPGEPFEIAGGYAFGALEGTLLCLLGSTAGSMLVFFLVRKFGLRAAGFFFSAETLSSLRFLKTDPKRNFLYLLIFMIPGTPKDLLCYFAGMTDLPVPVWLLICSLGRLPSIVTSTVGGDALGSKRYALAAAVFFITLLISAAGLFFYQRLCAKKKNG